MSSSFQVSDFRIHFESKIGKGAFGVVVDADWPINSSNSNSRPICAKIFNDPRSCKNEIEILSHLSRFPYLPNIVTILSFGSFEGKQPIIIMEKLMGGELFEVIVRRGRFSERDAAKCMFNLATGLKHLHKTANILHRDVKLDNLVFVDESHSSDLKLIDFGLAVKLSADDIDKGVRIRTRAAVGTQGYMSPEIIRDFVYSSKSDVWAAGVSLYTLLSGFFPFEQNDLDVQTRQVLVGRYRSLDSTYWRHVSDDAKDLVKRMLTVRTSARISIEDILTHPWIRHHTVATTEQFDNEYMQRIRKLTVLKKFRKVLNSIIWTLRLQRAILRPSRSQQTSLECMNSNADTNTDDDPDTGFTSSSVVADNDNFDIADITKERLLFIKEQFHIAAAECKQRFLPGSLLAQLSLEEKVSPSPSIPLDDEVDFLAFQAVMEKVNLKSLGAPHIFKLFDTDGNGFVDSREFLFAIATFCNTREDVTRLYFDLLDVDGSGEIEFQEMQSVLASILLDRSAKSLLTRPMTEVVAEASRMADLEERDPGSCKSSLSARNLFNFASLGTDHESLEHLFNAIDVDGSGKISYDEFKAWIERDGNFLQTMIVDSFKFTNS